MPALLGMSYLVTSGHCDPAAKGLQMDVFRLLSPFLCPSGHPWPLHAPILRLWHYLPLLLATPNMQWLPLCPSSDSEACSGWSRTSGWPRRWGGGNPTPRVGLKHPCFQRSTVRGSVEVAEWEQLSGAHHRRHQDV